MRPVKSKKASSGATPAPDQSLKISELEQKLTDLQDKLARSLADYSNLTKRIESQREIYALLASTAIISKMVDVLDNFLLAYKHLPDPGLKMAIDRFLAVLKEEGLVEIPAEGKEFDPSIMECVGVSPGKDNTVISIENKGYMLKDVCLRPVKVIVGRKNN